MPRKIFEIWSEIWRACQFQSQCSNIDAHIREKEEDGCDFGDSVHRADHQDELKYFNTSICQFGSNWNKIFKVTVV